MKKVKQINLLQTKEKLQQQKTISHLVQIQSETEKCIKIGNDLEELAKDKANDKEVANAYAFQANRQLMQKLMDQREILLNRQEYLEQEKIATSIEINRSIAKNEVLEKRKLKEKLIDARKKNTKIDENNFIPSKR